jgi:predicted ATPase
MWGSELSQVLPVIVALLIAAKGQMVYIEQPELHLHPKAQVNLAEIISESVKEMYLL